MKARTWWSLGIAAVWCIGATIFGMLVLRPRLGLHAFWNVLIPVAPALLAIAPGLWRNVCPMASTALAPRRVGGWKRRKLSAEANARLGLVGVVLLFALVPLRHVLFDLSGPATALVIALLAATAVTVGLLFEWKSGWCSGLCPVHPVERLYGSRPALTVLNAHCSPCQECVSVCPDARPGLRPLSDRKQRPRHLAATIMAGGFVGFVWGWFHVPNSLPGQGFADLGRAYLLPLGAAAVSLAIFVTVRRWIDRRHDRTLQLGFAAAAVACYYWYRIPALFGFGLFEGDGMLVDLSGMLPAWAPVASQVVTTAFFGWWLLLRTAERRSWTRRPVLARLVAQTSDA